MSRILFTGFGTVGQLVLDQLLRWPERHRVLVACREPDRTVERLNLAALTAAHLGFEPDVRATALDLFDIDRTAELLARFEPDVVFQCATLQSWWVIRRLPRPVFEELDQSQVGPWLPFHLSLVHKLMKAVRRSGRSPAVVNCSFPDATHPILATRGLSPTTGIGNVANCAAPLRVACAHVLGVPAGRVKVRLVAQHFVSHRLPRAGQSLGAPLIFRCYVDGEDVTASIADDTVFARLPRELRRVGGREGSLMTATSALIVLRAVAGGGAVDTHAPGPNGLPGGYPVRVADGRVDLDLPGDISLEQALQVNRDGLRFDGIEDISPDGTITYTDREMRVLERTLGYSCKQMTLDETDDYAAALRDAYARFEARHLGAAA